MAEQSSNELTVDKKLSDIFDEGYNLYIELETTSLPFNSLEFQDKVRKCIKLFEDSTRLVSIIGMFSSNENVEEIATDHIKYLLLPYYLGELSTKISKNDREEVLKVADVYYNDFLKRCEEYEICTSTNTNVIQKSGIENNEIRNLIQMASNRNSKIEQYRQKKELEEQLKELKASVERDHVDDEIKRDFYMKTLKVAIINAKEEIQSIKQELEILAFRNARSQNDEELPQSSSNTTHSNRQHHHHQHRSKIEPLKPIIITRDLAQKAVFGMGYPSLPVMSVDEFYEQRVREGIFPNAEQAVEMNKKMFQRGNSEEKEDEEKAEKEVLVENDDPQYLERQRQMDEYKDFVRRGQGNRYNRS